jgi:TPR repeat protein
MRNIMRYGMLVCSVSMFFTVSARAGSYEDAQSAFEQRDNAKGVGILTTLADQGNAVAQENLGSRYLNGKGVPVDYVAALKWLHMAADREDRGAPRRVDAGGSRTARGSESASNDCREGRHRGHARKR